MFHCKALCKIGLACRNTTLTPPEGCECGSGARCQPGESCVTSSPDSGLCVPACTSSTTEVVLATSLCGCNLTVCSPGQTCDMLTSQCVLPCDNPALSPDNNIEPAGTNNHFIGRQEFTCKPGYYIKIKQVHISFYIQLFLNLMFRQGR